MTRGEHQAINVANKYYPDITISGQLKKLGEEVIEFTEAVLIGNDDQIADEAGDCLYLILHILSKKLPPERINQTTLVVNASDKLERRLYLKTLKK